MIIRLSGLSSGSSEIPVRELYIKPPENVSGFLNQSEPASNILNPNTVSEGEQAICLSKYFTCRPFLSSADILRKGAL